MDGRAVKPQMKPQQKTSDDYIRSHELSLLHLLAQKYPEVIIKIAEKVACKPQRLVV